MTKQEAIWYANHVFNIVIERCFNAQNLKEAREFDEAKQIVIKALEQKPKRGKWILGKREWEDNYIFTCSECSHDIVTPKTQKIPYCWFCGARMEDNEE